MNAATDTNEQQNTKKGDKGKIEWSTGKDALKGGFNIRDERILDDAGHAVSFIYLMKSHDKTTDLFHLKIG